MKMDKKTLENLKRNMREVNRKHDNFHHIVADELFWKLTKLTAPLDWSASTEDEQPVILIPLKIPKAFTDFLDPFTKGTEGAKEKILQALGDRIVNTGLSEGALHDVDIDDKDVEKFKQVLNKMMKAEKGE